MVPVAGEGISVSTLSVETSRSGSSTLIVSPTFLSQRVTVPSVTDSPRAGIVTTTPADAGAAATGAEVSNTGGATTGAGVSTTAATGVGVSTTGEATGAAAAAATPSSITANSAPTATVESIATTMRVRVPDTGEGISVSTLSVETSSSGSSTFT